jgi:ABC-type branched-subunit amino acid transport system permease subunit
VLLALSNGLSVLGVIVLIRAGQVSFGHAMFACLAGYGVTFIVRAWPLDALRVVALGTAGAALSGALIGVFMVRDRGISFGMLNLAFSRVLFSVLGKFGGITGGTEGLRFDRPTFGVVLLFRPDAR